MRLPLEDDTGLNMAACDISFAEDPFSEDSESGDPIFWEVKDTLCRIGKEKGRKLDLDEGLCDDLKFENYLSESELRQWRKMPQTDRVRILRKVYDTEEYQKLRESLTQYQTFALQKPAVLSGRVPGRERRNGKAKCARAHDSENRNAGMQNDTKGQMPETQNSGESNSGQREEPSILDTEGASAGDEKSVLSQGMKAVKKAADIFKEERQFAWQDDGEQQKQEAKSVKSAITRGIAAVISAVAAAVSSPVVVIVFTAILIVSIILFPLLAVLLDSANTVADNPGIMPYYAQADYPAVPFDGKTIKSSGCGITSMAMVVSLFKGEAVTPPTLADMANQDPGYNTVQSHQAISKFAEYYELGDVEQMGGPSMNCCGNKAFDMDYIKEKIAASCPVIVSLTGGYYNPSGGGHYIALYGSGKGGVFVYDPGNRSKYAESLKNDGSDWNEVFSHSKHIWIFQSYIPPDYMDTGDGTNCMMTYLCLKQAGFSDAAAAGVIGNMWQECAHGAPDLRPAMESADGSIGLLQWKDGRRISLENLARNRNSSWMDISVQTEYLLQEINSGSQWIWTGYAAGHYPVGCNMLLEEYKQLEDPERAAEVFCAKFVRPNYEKANLPYRKEMACQFLQKVAQN